MITGTSSVMSTRRRGSSSATRHLTRLNNHAWRGTSVGRGRGECDVILTGATFDGMERLCLRACCVSNLLLDCGEGLWVLRPILQDGDRDLGHGSEPAERLGGLHAHVWRLSIATPRPARRWRGRRTPSPVRSFPKRLRPTRIRNHCSSTELAAQQSTRGSLSWPADRSGPNKWPRGGAGQAHQIGGSEPGHR